MELAALQMTVTWKEMPDRPIGSALNRYCLVLRMNSSIFAKLFNHTLKRILSPVCLRSWNRPGRRGEPPASGTAAHLAHQVIEGKAVLHPYAKIR